MRGGEGGGEVRGGGRGGEGRGRGGEGRGGGRGEGRGGEEKGEGGRGRRRKGWGEIIKYWIKQDEGNQNEELEIANYLH